MGKFKFTPEQEQIICQRYLAGENTMELGKAFGVTDGCIGRILKRNGVEMRSNSESKGGLGPELEAEVCRRYVDGESAYKIAKAFRMHASTINRILKRNGVETRSLSEAQGGLKPEQEDEVCRRYVNGESTIALGKAFGITPQAVHAILKRNGVKTRSMSEALGGLKPELEPEVCRRYEAGENTYELGKAFGVSDSTIGQILKRNGVETRSNMEAQGGLKPELEPEVCRRYSAGEATTELGKTFGVTPCTINKILKRNGVEMRGPIEAQGGLKPELEPEVCRRYEEGESTYELGKVFGVSYTSISAILKRNGVERRGAEGFSDSVQHVLGCTGHHTHARDCSFYVFELARYSDTHCKPGIAFDADKRAANSEGEYGEEALRLEFSTRAEAFFLEQAVLDATRGNADCPADLAGWIGASEVRAMPADDMVAIVLRLADELEELGLWSFAAHYLPMPAAQRATCQQRAMEVVAA